MSWLTAVVIGRILAESGTPPPDVEDPAILLIKRKDVVVGCTPGDAGMLGDAATDAVLDGPVPDAAIPPDAPSDAGVGDGGIDDGGTPDASTCEMIPGDAVTLVIQPQVLGAWDVDMTRFAILLVTPERPIVELQGDVFGGLARVTAPRIEEHIVEVPDSSMGTVCSTGSCGGGGGGGGCGGDFGDGTSWTPPGVSDAGLGDGGLVEEMIGPYQFVRAKPADAMQLAQWLDQLGYAYMQDDLDAAAPYISMGYHVVAIRVSYDKPLRAAMTPIALTWPGSELRIPASLGHGAVSPGQLTVYVAAEGRYTLPGASVRFAKRTNSGAAGFLTRMEIQLDQSKPQSMDPVAMRVMPDTEYQEVEIVTKEVKVPVEVNCLEDDDDDRGCCRDCSANRRTRYDWLAIVLTLGFVLRPRRRRRRSA